MANTTVKVYRSIIKEFLENHRDIAEQNLERAMYIGDAVEMFIFECREWKGVRKTFVFVYECGHFSECRTEYNTFNKYLFSHAPDCHHLELMEL